MFGGDNPMELIVYSLYIDIYLLAVLQCIMLYLDI